MDVICINNGAKSKIYGSLELKISDRGVGKTAPILLKSMLLYYKFRKYILAQNKISEIATTSYTKI